MKENIALIGMMGSGKTTVGKSLSNALSMMFADTDELIEYTYAPITNLFSLFGEEGFRKYEKRVISSVSEYKDACIATGGGVVLDEENMENLKKNYTIIYLRATKETILKRTKGSDRPLLQGNAKENIAKILSEREPKYLKYADIIVDTDRKSVNKITKEIIKKLMEKIS